MTKYQRAGRLDEVLLVKDEIKNISDGKWPLLALPKKISLEVAEPRKLYLKKRIKIEQNAARETAKTADKMLALLEKQAVNLTKKGDLQQALLARQIKDDIEGGCQAYRCPQATRKRHDRRQIQARPPHPSLRG